MPDEDFVCETTRCTELDVGLDAAPGVCPGGERQLMLSVRNDSHESVMVQRGLPLAVAVETIAELASSVSPDSLTGEEIAKRAVKTGNFTTEAVLEFLRKMKIPLSDSRDNVLPVGVEKIRSMLLGLYCHGPHFGVSTATKEFPWTLPLMIGSYISASVPVVPVHVDSGEQWVRLSTARGQEKSRTQRAHRARGALGWISVGA